MKKVLIWDLPLRIFHWIFAACILAALTIALTADDHSQFFKLHMLLGLSAGMLLFIRIIIALFGARYSRLPGLLFNPKETFYYITNAFSVNAKKYYGHNPGTAAAAIVMFILLAGLIISGLTINSELSEDIHPLLAYTFIAVIASHLLGLLLHTIIYRENISATIISGKKHAPDEAAIKSSQTIAGILSLVFIAGWFFVLFKSYSPGSSELKIPFTDKQIILGEQEDEVRSEDNEEKYERDRD